MKKVVFPITLAILLLFTTSCMVVTLGDELNPVDVSYALEKVEMFHGRKVYIKCYPVAYYESYSFLGSKSYMVFFSDSASDYRGKLDSLEDCQDNWLETMLHEDDALWKGIKEVFYNNKEPEKLILVFRGMKDTTFGYYLAFDEWYS